MMVEKKSKKVEKSVFVENRRKQREKNATEKMEDIKKNMKETKQKTSALI